MSEIGKLIKSNGLTWAQIETYLVSKNTSPATISNLQCVFEEEMGISQPAPTNQSIGSDGTSIYSEEYNGTFLDSPDNIFQESDAMDNRPKISQKDRDMLLNVIYDIKGGVVDVTPNNEPDRRLKDSPSDAYNRIVQDKTNQELMGTTEIRKDNAQEELTQNSITFEEPSVQDSEYNNSLEGVTADYTADISSTDNLANQLTDEPSTTNITSTENPLPTEFFNPAFGITNAGFNNPWAGFNVNNTGFSSDFTTGLPTDYNISIPMGTNTNFSGFTGFNNFISDSNIDNNPYKITLPTFSVDITNNTPSIGINDTASATDDPTKAEDPTKTEEPEDIEYPKLLQDRLDELNSAGDTYELTGDSKKGYTILVTAGDYLDKYKIKSIKFKLDGEGVLKNQYIKYQNGKALFVDYNNGRKAINLDGDYEDEGCLDNFVGLATENPSDNTTVSYNEEENTYTVVQTGLKDSNIEKITTTMTKEPWQARDGETAPADIKKEDYIKEQVITYKDGHEEVITYDKGEIKSKTTGKSGETSDKPTKLRTAAKISFELPDNANKHCKDFSQALCDNKQALMDELDLDNDTYNELAQTAMAIAEKETQMMKKDITSRLFWKDVAKEAIALVKGSKANCSLGITQIKLGSWYNNPPKSDEQERLRPFFEKYGITKPEDLEDDKKAAIATMIALSSLNLELRKEKYKKGVEKAEQLTVKEEGWELDENGIARKTGNTKPWKNNITKQDQLLLFWNMGSAGRKILAEGKFVPQTIAKNEKGEETTFMYMNVARKANLKYKLVEDKNERKAVEDKELERLKEEKEIKRQKEEKLKDEKLSEQVEFFDNSGPIGAIRFMPGMYSNAYKHTNSEKEINKLKEKLDKKGIDKKLSNELLTALKNKEMSFDFGLRESEMDSLTEDDIKLLLEHLNKLKDSIKYIKTSDGISSKEGSKLRKEYRTEILKAEKSFKKEYFNKHSKLYDISSNNPEVLRATSTEEQKTEVPGYKGRFGFLHQKSKGVNVNTTDGKIRKTDEILAKKADKVARSNTTKKDGYCLTGVKTAMSEAGIDVSEMTKYGNTPKYAKNWFDMMVSKGLMVQIKYVEVSKGKGRAINESDIGTLPAGCIVIFVPDLEGGYKEQAGHIVITNGYGQGNADITDDLDWANFTRNDKTSGKGEHGTFYVYKLSDKWIVGEDGKLKIKE